MREGVAPEGGVTVNQLQRDWGCNNTLTASSRGRNWACHVQISFFGKNSARVLTPPLTTVLVLGAIAGSFAVSLWRWKECYCY